MNPMFGELNYEQQISILHKHKASSKGVWIDRLKMIKGTC